MTSLLEEIEKYVTDFFITNEHERFVYHNLTHTQKVVKRAKILSVDSDLNDKEKELLFISAWFHDIGYLVVKKEHEEKSVELARKYLNGKFSDEDLQIIEDTILATRYPQHPKTKVAEYLCDSDMYHLSLENFFEISLLLRDEIKSLTKNKLSKLDYWKETLALFNDHSYHTPYGKKILAENKERNRQILIKKIEKIENKKLKNAKTPLPKESLSIDASKAEADKYRKEIFRLESKLEKLKEPSRGIETMFRVTGRNQINLSSIADNKANIMISVNVIVISVVLSTIADDLAEMPIMTFPVLLILLTCLLTIIFAVLSTRPNISTGKFTKKDIEDRKVNLMFFGNFFNVSLEEYEWGIKELMKDYDYLYETLIKDQYFLGKVLAKKYRNLRTAYTVFMYGFILSVFVFSIVLLFSGISL